LRVWLVKDVIKNKTFGWLGVGKSMVFFAVYAHDVLNHQGVPSDPKDLNGHNVKLLAAQNPGTGAPGPLP